MMRKYLSGLMIVISMSMVCTAAHAQTSREEKDREFLEQRRQANPKFQAAQKKAQAKAQRALNEYRPLAVATTYHEKCKKLSLLSYKAASYAKQERQQLLISLGAMKSSQFDEFETKGKNWAGVLECYNLAALPRVENAIKHADFQRDLYLLTLLRYNDHYSRHPNLCMDRFEMFRTKIVEAGEAAKLRLSKSPDFAALGVRAKERADEFRSKCESGTEAHDPHSMLLNNLVLGR